MTDAAVGGGPPGATAPGTASPAVLLPAGVAAEHRAAVAAFREAYAALPAGAPVRLAKRASRGRRWQRRPVPARRTGRTAGLGPRLVRARTVIGAARVAEWLEEIAAMTP